MNINQSFYFIFLFYYHFYFVFIHDIATLTYFLYLLNSVYHCRYWFVKCKCRIIIICIKKYKKRSGYAPLPLHEIILPNFIFHLVYSWVITYIFGLYGKIKEDKSL